MKKETFYRAKRNKNGELFFTADSGYLYTACHGGEALNFIISKTPSGWDITHDESGIKATSILFSTRADAIECITKPGFLEMVIKAVKTEWMQEYIKALNNYKKEI